MKKILFIFLLVVLYFLSCWVVDLQTNMAILDSSGQHFTIQHNILYNKFTFYDVDKVEYITNIINWDRIFILCLAIVMFVKRLLDFNKR